MGVIALCKEALFKCVAGFIATFRSDGNMVPGGEGYGKWKGNGKERKM